MASPVGKVIPPLLSLTAAIGLTVAALVSPSALPVDTVCWFKRLTTVPCPGCGLTRSVCGIAHGEWGYAWGMNPFGYVFVALALVALMAPVVARVAPGSVKRLSASHVHWVGPVVLVGAMWVYGIGRILGWV